MGFNDWVLKRYQWWMYKNSIARRNKTSTHKLVWKLKPNQAERALTGRKESNSAEIRTLTFEIEALEEGADDLELNYLIF